MNATQLLEHFDRLAEAPNAVPRLRRFILDLAVRGKLVEQDAGDEPATRLVEHIEAEKSRLVQAGLAAKQEVFKFRSDAEMPFVLPNAWIWVPATFPAYMSSDLGKKVQTKEVLQSGKFPVVDQGKVFIRGYCNDQDKVIRVAAPMILFGDHTRETKLIDFDFVVGADGVKLLQPVCLFTRYYFLSLKWLPLDNRGYGRHFKLLKAAFIPLPPLSEQHRIVAKVDELMALCDQLEAAQQERERRSDRLARASLQRLNHPAVDATPETQREHARFHLHHFPRLTTRPEHIKAMRQTIHKLAITGQITEQDKNDEPASVLLTKNLQWRAVAIKHKKIRDPRKELLAVEANESPYLLPEQWCWARLGEVIYIRSGDGLIAANMKDGPIPVFGGNGVNGHHDSVNVNKPTLVVGRVGYYCGSVHITPEKAWITDNAFITHFCPDLFSLRFLALLLATTNLKENEGATAQPVISGSKIYPLIVGIPPLAEQHRIVAKVDALMALCDQLEAQLTATQTDSRRLLEAVLEAALAPA